jgi:hypothetical protein
MTFLLVASFVQLTCAQGLSVVWQQVYGGSADELLTSIRPTSDNGAILARNSLSAASGDKSVNNCMPGTLDYWLVKVDSLGNKEWDRTIGGDNADFLTVATQTSDLGYIVSGFSLSNASCEKSSNNCSLNGGSNNDIWVMKLDASGNIEWEKTIGGWFSDVAYAAVQTNDGGYAFGGGSISGTECNKTTGNNGGRDFWIVKTDPMGNVLWQKSYGGNLYDGLFSMITTNDNGLLCSGYSRSGISGDQTSVNYGDQDFWTLKLDSTGSIQWQSSFGGSGKDIIFAAEQTSDNGFILGGMTDSPISGTVTESDYGNYDYYIVKIDSLGNEEWQARAGGSANDECRTINEMPNGNYFVAGYSESGISGNKTTPSNGGSDYWVMELSPSGTILWQQSIGGSGDDNSAAGQMIMADGKILIAGDSDSPVSGDKTITGKGGTDYWILKLEPSVTGIATNEGHDQISVSPNPATEFIRFFSDKTINGIHIYDSTGRLVISEALNLQVQGQHSIDTSTLEPGAYLLSVTDKDGRQSSERFIKL